MICNVIWLQAYHTHQLAPVPPRIGRAILSHHAGHIKQTHVATEEIHLWFFRILNHILFIVQANLFFAIIYWLRQVDAIGYFT